MDDSTSLQRTYRYLRIGIGATIVVIFVAVFVVSIGAHHLRPSISEYFYTPARSAFTGALVAASIALFALAGRGPERALLNAAAIFAPLIAFVSTPIKGIAGCTSKVGCVPDAAIPDIDTGVATYLIIGGATFVAVLLVVLLRKIRIRDVWVSLIIGGAVLLAVLLVWQFGRDFFLSNVHYISAVTFFGLIGAAAVFNVWIKDVANPPATWMKAIYWVVTVGMVVDMGYLVVVVVTQHGAPAAPPDSVPLVFIGESIALTFFLLFWIVQSIQKWDEPNPIRQSAR